MQSMYTSRAEYPIERPGIEIPQSSVPPTSVASKNAGMSIAMVETGGAPGHERDRHTYEKAGFELFPVARYFKKLGSADVKSQSLLCSIASQSRSPNRVMFGFTLP